MKRPTFSATAVVNARRDPDQRSLELNLVDAKGNEQNVVLSQLAVTHVLGAVSQKIESFQIFCNISRVTAKTAIH